MHGVWLGDPAFYWSGDRYASAAVQSALPSAIHRILPDLVTGAFDNSFFITQFFLAHDHLSGGTQPVGDIPE